MIVKSEGDVTELFTHLISSENHKLCFKVPNWGYDWKSLMLKFFERKEGITDYRSSME